MEIWRDIPEYEGLYQVSNKGRVRGLKRKLILKQSSLTGGYMYVWLCKNNERKIKRVHRLVASAFIPNPNHKATVNHIDKNRTNNSVDNLEWNTYSENQKHAYTQGRNFNIDNAHRANSKAINVYKDGIFICQYNSLKECANDLGLNDWNIRVSIIDHWKHYKGYTFSYATH